jgi:uncharacterized protein
VLVPWQGAVGAWAPTSIHDISDADVQQLVALGPELVIFGSGPALKFARSAIWKPLMSRRIGFETMDTPAACRTYNVLLSEGRAVVAALIVGAG